MTTARGTARTAMHTEDWIGLRLQRTRPLPLTVVPVHNETVESYLARLARANHVTGDHLREYLTGSTRKSAPIPISRLVLLTGQPERTLGHALPELTDLDQRDRCRPVVGHAAPRQRRCELCTRARGHSGWIICWAHPHDVVCLRHARWIGDHRSHHQLDLSDHPDILKANRLHRRLVHRFGSDQTNHAFEQAQAIVSRWHDKHLYEQDFLRHMADFHGRHWRVSSTHPTIAAAAYPQTVALTRLLASPHWQRAGRARPVPIAFVAEVRATVAPRYEWTPGQRYGNLEPLVEAVLEGDGPSVRPQSHRKLG